MSKEGPALQGKSFLPMSNGMEYAYLSFHYSWPHIHILCWCLLNVEGGGGTKGVR